MSVCGDRGEKDRRKRTTVNSLADYRERQLDGQKGQQLADFVDLIWLSCISC